MHPPEGGTPAKLTAGLVIIDRPEQVSEPRGRESVAKTIAVSVPLGSATMKSESAMNVVVTGGGTIAPIDDVRFMTNISSGRFAAAITEACLDRGANVWHVHAAFRAASVSAVRRVRS